VIKGGLEISSSPAPPCRVWNFFFLKVVQTGVVDYGGSFLERAGAAGSWTFSGRMMQGNLGRILIRKIYETTRVDSR
jgi:hypothetical protein